MSTNFDVGIRAEQFAISHFQNLGFSILHKNWRHSRHEIDLITEKDGILHFVEVKARRKSEIDPEVNVTSKKFRSMQKAARNFLYQHPKYKKIQFDILSVVMQKDEAPEFFLIEDVYI